MCLLYGELVSVSVEPGLRLPLRECNGSVRSKVTCMPTGLRANGAISLVPGHGFVRPDGSMCR